MPAKKTEASHRTSPLRKLQNVIAGQIPGILGYLDSYGLFPNTHIHEVMQDPSRQLHADDITLSHLQMTSHICSTIREGKAFPHFGFQYILASFLNGADGPVARKMGTVTKEGGIKDAVVDRLSEMMVADLVAEQLSFSPERKKEIQSSFQLSTLTKAACEMGGVKTKEGGVGGMIERRKILFLILQNLIKMNSLPSHKKSQRDILINSINTKLDKLITDSTLKAQERIEALAKKSNMVSAPEDPDIPGATEARKYVGVVIVNNSAGIDIVGELNSLSGGRVHFPSVEDLIDQRMYVRESVEKVTPFLNEALSIAGYSST